VRRYLQVLADRQFALLWTGATVSALGDSVTWVALAWMVYLATGSPVQVGFLVAAYTAPVVLGGGLAGLALDRFDRRTVLIVDNALRGIVMGTIPVLSRLGVLQLWHYYAVASTYGLMKMFSLAGVPAIIPSLVAPAHLNTANALESISFGASSVAGPALGAFLIGTIGGPNVLLADALTYFFFVVCLLGVSSFPPDRRPGAPRLGLRPAVQFILATPAIRMITVMFAAFNIGDGMLSTLVPVYAREVFREGVSTYGLLLSAMGFGGLVGAIFVGAIAWPWPLGRSIAAAQLTTGVGFLALLLAPSRPATLALFAALGFLTSPLTVWAQTIRMHIIPHELRGRVFSLLRTLMQSTPPIGGALAGVLLSGVGVAPAILVIGLVVGMPGVLGLMAPDLAQERVRGSPDDAK
jgi:MFS family permease